MVGDGVLVSPVLDQGATSVSAYFSKGLWYDLWDTKNVIDSGGESRTLDAPLDFVPLHMKGGHVLTMQPHALTTSEVGTALVAQQKINVLCWVSGVSHWNFSWRQVKEGPMTVVIALPRRVSHEGNERSRLMGQADASETMEISGCDFCENATSDL